MLKYLKSRWQEIGWAVLIASTILVVTVESQPTTTLSFGTSTTILDTSSTGSVTGTTYALPAGYAQVIQFQSIIAGGASAISLPLQASLDGSNWQTIATFTTSTGQIFTTGVTSYRFIRAVQNSRTGGTNTQLVVAVNRAFAVTSSSSNINSANIGLADGSNTAPSLYFNSNTDTGIRYISPDTVGVLSDGVQRFLVSSTTGVQAGANIIPMTDNGRDLGSSSFQFRTGYFGTSIIVNGSMLVNSSQSVYGNAFISGTNPATAGNVRLPHGGSILARQSTNSADTTLLSYGSVATDQMVLGTSGINLRMRSNLGTPTTLANNEWWVQCTGTTPSRVCSLMVQDGGATRTIASMTY